MVCCATDGVCDEDEEGRARARVPQGVGNDELEGNDEEDDPLCQWLVSHELCHLKTAKMSFASERY